MSTQAIEAGRAFVKLMVEDKEFARGLQGSLQKLNAFSVSAVRLGAALGAVGAVITAPFAAATKAFTSVGGELADMQSRTSLSARALTELKYAAEQTGTSLQAVEKAAREMQSKGIDPNKIFEFAAGIAAIEDPTQRAQAAFELWGKKAGSAMLPLLQQLPQLRDEANKLGLVWSQDMIQKADALGDAMGGIVSQFGAFSATLANAVAPELTAILGKFNGALKVAIDFTAQHKSLAKVVGVTGFALLSFGTVLGSVNLILWTTTKSVLSLRSALTALSKHPYLIAATLTLGALIDVLGPTIEKWLGLSDAADTATQAVGKHTSAEQELGEVLDENIAKFDARAEALKRLHAEENKAAQEAAVGREVERQKSREEILGTRQLAGFGGLSVEIQQRQKALADLRSELANIESKIAGNVLVDESDTQRIAELTNQIKALSAELGNLQAQSFLTSPFGLASLFGFGRPFGLLGGSLTRDLFRGYSSGERIGRGLRGDTSRPQLLNSLVPELTGPRGTFNGRLAGQIFGQDRGLNNRLQMLITKSQKMIQHLESIDRKTNGAVGPQFKVGIA